MIPKETLDAILDLQSAAQMPQEAAKGGDPFVMVPSNHKLESIAHLCPPKRVERAVRMIEAGSFCDYVNRFKNPDTLIFATVTPTGASLKAILDYHHAPMDGGEPQATYCRHTVTLDLVETEDWKRWLAANRKPMTQVEFATWLEDNAALFNSVKEGELKGADLLELVSTLHGKSDVRFNTMLRLKDGGNRLNYEEDVGVQGQLRNESIELPPVITAALQPFDGGPYYPVPARLKTRIEGRKLTIWFETVGLHKVVRTSVTDTVRLVADKTQIVPLLGTP